MPKTRLQDFVFSILMAFAMVYAMELYNLALEKGGLSNELFLAVFKDAFMMMIIVIILEKLIGGRVARKLAFRLVDPIQDRPIVVTLAIQCFTVCLMAPMMSMVATIIFKHPGNQVIAVWLQTLIFNFPLALLWQIFFAGPLVRFIFGKLFSVSSVSAQEIEMEQ